MSSVVGDAEEKFGRSFIGQDVGVSSLTSSHIAADRSCCLPENAFTTIPFTRPSSVPIQYSSTRRHLPFGISSSLVSSFSGTSATRISIIIIIIIFIIIRIVALPYRYNVLQNGPVTDQVKHSRFTCPF